jgi:hypothetical protein
MNQQTIAESRKILHVVDDLIDDLRTLSLLPPNLSAMPSQDMQHLTSAFGDAHTGREAQMQLSDHFDLERKLESAAADATPEEIMEHHLSTRALVDTMRKAGYPQYRASYPSSENITRFISIITTLRSLLNDRFNTTVEDDVVKFAILNDTVNRERTASDHVQALNREHANLKQSRKVEVKRKDDSISKLKEEYRMIQESSAQEQQNVERMSTEHKSQDESKFEKAREDLEAEVSKLENQLQALEDQCQASESLKRQERTKRESGLNHLIMQYDNEMKASTDWINSLQKEIDRDSEQLREVEKELAVYNAENENHRLEELIEDRRKSHRYEMESRHNDYARVVQAFWRAYAVRLALNKKKKKKK